jgi:hypothetical protein
MMTYSKKRSLCAALSCVSALGSAQVHAGEWSGPCQGQASIHLYHPTHAGRPGNAYPLWPSDGAGRAVAQLAPVNVLEGKNGRDLTNFNMFLSPFDVWAAPILPDIATSGAKIGTLGELCELRPVSMRTAATASPSTSPNSGAARPSVGEPAMKSGNSLPQAEPSAVGSDVTPHTGGAAAAGPTPVLSTYGGSFKHKNNTLIQ